MRYLVACVLAALTFNLQAQDAVGGKTRVRIYDARPPHDGAPLAIYLNTLRGTKSSIPGKETTWGELSAGSYALSAKDERGKVVATGSVKFEADAYVTIFVGFDSGSLKFFPISISGKQIQEFQKKNAGTALFVPVNFSGKDSYTFHYTTVGENPTPTTTTVAPGTSAMFQAEPTSDWTLTSGDKTVSRNLFPPTKFMAGHIAMIALPEHATDTGRIIPTDGSGGSLLINDQ